MQVGIYINFLNETRQAISFYEQVFGIKCEDLMDYEQIGHPKGGDYNKLILNGSLNIHGTQFLFSDVDGHGFEHIVGNNVTIVLNYTDSELLDTEFNKLAEEGVITIELAETFWSKRYGMLIDKFGIGWQFNLQGE